MSDDEEAKNLLLGKTCKYCKFVVHCIYRKHTDSIFNFCFDFQLQTNPNMINGLRR